MWTLVWFGVRCSILSPSSSFSFSLQHKGNTTECELCQLRDVKMWCNLCTV
ncbi:hypothetical protein KC19_5G031600 [Ceratodon purpureus]|uniref:Uncharacterized protein n=1 Tax=Ceratodon purpureus TaxID=3225 RepID=A0A8T0HZR6_CERPU|nr:hypothetical protein KC19_5G031600 [Ceratodon purpureus]